MDPAAREPTLSRGMSFPDSKAAFYAVQDYALFHGKQVRVSRRGGKHRRMECKASVACPFFVQLYMHNSKADNSWYVSSFNLQHAPDCDSMAKPTQRQILESASFRRALQQPAESSASSDNAAAATSSSGRSGKTARELLAAVAGRANLRTIYRAKETIKRALRDELGASYRKIPSLLHVFQELNPGSFACYETDGPSAADSASTDSNASDGQGTTGAFRRAFVAAGVFLGAAGVNQQIYGLDCVRSSNAEAEYEGTQLFLLGKDGNRRNLVLAVACCDAPSRDNYRWFLQCVARAGVDLHYCPILCAMDPELLGLEAEMGLTLRYCTRFIIENELAQLNGFNRQHHHALVWGLQGSESPEEFANRLDWIATSCGPGVANFLRQLPLERWVVAGNIGKVSLYGWRSRNFYENVEQEQEDARASAASGGISNGSSNLNGAANFANDSSSAISSGDSSILVKRFQNLMPFAFLENMMLLFMETAFERNALASKWKQQGRRVTARAQELYESQFRRVGEYKVSRASETVAFVSELNKSPSLRRRVDLSTSSCTCSFIDQHAIPCRHLIAVLLFCSQMDSVYERFAPCYLVDNYALAFRGKSVELPLESSLTDDPTCDRAVGSESRRPRRAPETSASSGGPPRKKTRQQQQGQATRNTSSSQNGNDSEPGNDASRQPASQQPAVRVRLCKKCRTAGHNARSCSYQGPPPQVPRPMNGNGPSGGAVNGIGMSAATQQLPPTYH